VCGRDLPGATAGRPSPEIAVRSGPAPRRAGRQRSSQHQCLGRRAERRFAHVGVKRWRVASRLAGGAEAAAGRNLATQLLWDRRLAGGVEPRRAAAIATFTEALDACLEPR
jgi:hypothetical protein